MIRVERKRVIFVPFIDAFGGSERLVLDLSRFLYETGTPHVLACFRNTIDLQSYADWPLPLHQMRPNRNSVSEARSLHNLFELDNESRTVHPLLFDRRVLSIPVFFLVGLSSCISQIRRASYRLIPASMRGQPVVSSRSLEICQE